MRLHALRCLGVAGVPDCALDLRHDFVLVTGPAASGKTRLLELILAARERLSPSGAARAPDERWIARGAGTAKAVLTWAFDERERHPVFLEDAEVTAEVVFGGEPDPDPNLELLLRAAPREHGQPKIVHFPAHRRLDDKLRRALAAAPDQAGFAARLQGFLGEGRPLPTPEATPGAPLSSSEEDAVLLAGTATVVGLGRSLLLVDRPELFLDGLAPAALVRALLALGEGAQIIAASSSAALARSLPPEQVVRLGA